MKRFLIVLSLLVCNMVCADTINLHWLNSDGSTYQNSTCTIGADLIVPSTPPTKYGYTFTGWKMANYIPIEYLESTGTQWIDTGIYPATGWKIRVKALATTTSATSVLFGCTSVANAENAVNGIYRIIGGHVNRVAWGNGQGTVLVVNTSEYDTPNVWYDTICDNGVWTINNNFIKAVPASTFESEYSMWLFARNTGGQVGFPMYGRISLCQVWDNNNTLVRDFIPVLDYVGTPCMYDKVTKQFFYNAGTGDFIAGPVLQ